MLIKFIVYICIQKNFFKFKNKKSRKYKKSGNHRKLPYRYVLGYSFFLLIRYRGFLSIVIYFCFKKNSFSILFLIFLIIFNFFNLF